MLTAWLTCSPCLFLWVLKNKKEISWKKISQPQTPLCLRLSRNLPSPVVWDLDWILHRADLSAPLPMPEHPYAGRRDRGASAALAWCERLGLLEGLLCTAPAAWAPGSADPCTWVRMDLTSLVWGVHLPAKGHEAGAEETLPVQHGSPGSPAMKGPGFTAEAAPCFSRGCSHAGLVQKLLRMAYEILGPSGLNLRS